MAKADIATEFRNDDNRTKELGLSPEKMAFYDLLSEKAANLNQSGPNQDLVHRVMVFVKKNLQLDWTKKEEAKAAIRLALKRKLRGIVPISELNKLLKEVLERAERQYSDLPLVG